MMRAIQSTPSTLLTGVSGTGPSRLHRGVASSRARQYAAPTLAKSKTSGEGNWSPRLASGPLQQLQQLVNASLLASAVMLGSPSSSWPAELPSQVSSSPPGHVRDLWLESSFNGQDWPAALQAAKAELAAARSDADVQAVVPHMLVKLGDPFTRLVPAANSRAFKDDTTGQIVHAGCQVVPNTAGQLQISFVAQKSPALRRGVRVGDVLAAVDGRPVAAADLAAVRARLRQEVTLRLQRAELQHVGLSAATALRERSVAVHLVPEPLELYPVDARMLRSAAGTRIGYVGLSSFGQGTGWDVASALRRLQQSGAASLILDLRGNPGGLVNAGLEVAELLMRPDDLFGWVLDRSAREDPLFVGADMGWKMTSSPMVVLVDGGTASTSEILTASLHDNHRALLLGEHTFGKGFTQRVLPLRDGSTLLVSSSEIRTPKHHVIHKVGLEPDLACHPRNLAPAGAVQAATGAPAQQAAVQAPQLEDDPCIMLALQHLP